MALPERDQEKVAGATRARTDRRSNTIWFLVVGVFVVSTDFSLTVVLVPTIDETLGVGAEAGDLLVTVPLVTSAATYVLMGRLSDRISPSRMLPLAYALMIVVSLAMALAPSFGVALTARALQGIACAAFIPSALAVLNAIHHEGSGRKRLFALWSASIGAAWLVSLPLGSLLADAVSWRWVYLLLVPIEIVSLIGTWTTLPNIARGPKTTEFDVTGAVGLVISTGAIVVALQSASEVGWWTATGGRLLGLTWPLAIAPTPILLGGGVVLLTGTLLYEKTRQRDGHSVVLALEFFAIEKYRFSTAVIGFMSAGQIATLVLIPVFTVFVLGFDTFGSGLLLAAIGLGLLLGGPVTTRSTIDRSVLVASSVGLQALSILSLIVLFRAQPGLLALPMLGLGFGWGAAYALLLDEVLVDLPSEQVAVGSGTQVATRFIATAFATALATAVLGAYVTRAEVETPDLDAAGSLEVEEVLEFSSEPDTVSPEVAHNAAMREVAEIQTRAIRFALVVPLLFTGTGTVLALRRLRTSQQPEFAGDRDG